MGDQYLRNEIQGQGKIRKCFHCKTRRNACNIKLVATKVERVFESHFVRTDTEPSAWEYTLIKEMDYDWDREGEPVSAVVAEIAGVDDEVADAIVEELEDRHSDFDSAAMGEECEFDSQSHYAPRLLDGYNRYHQSWNSLEERLRHECRFIGRSSQAILDEVFAEVESLVTREGGPVVRLIGPGTTFGELFRARVFQSIIGLEKGLARPDLEVGPPPLGQASAGRMNAQGISVFYGALDAGTALAEVRPPVGANVIVTKFRVTRDLRVLDVAALKEIITRESYFDPRHQQLLERAAFLGILAGKMTAPVLPGNEGSQYLVTQVVADYLASEHDLDGMIYPSVQVTNGVNVVLFHRASRVAAIDLPEGTEIEIEPDGWDEDGPSDDFLVVERVPGVVPPPARPAHEGADNSFLLGMLLSMESGDLRQISLEILLDQTEVRRVRSVVFHTAESGVRRVRREGEE
ncbi:RES family NAD+ phosphorylase [Luteolibacter ambystomatis]|uniref:RES family NAD+ phosphorylase n=1 Tax=Luteolibacter ambystomatis TaxID=2824561 RepID=A0A975PG30_9BACT|nr:RES family NAD+ phosphorylase [Luteolibacter ambystomatis]QUE52255.1 RES family NAD+ phosphorylase [Luteolibacter ambystomatis]